MGWDWEGMKAKSINTMSNVQYCNLQKKSKNFIIKFQAYFKKFVIWWERKQVYKYCTPSNV
jgi:hypothetical protein